MHPAALNPLTRPVESYEDALAFVDALDVSAMKLGLSRIARLLGTLGNPQDQLPMVHIAGSNGKGSTTAMLASVLKSAGYQVGTFTSPHLIHVRERIAINGNPILPDDFQEEVAALQGHLLGLDWPSEDWPTYFEFLNVLAYQYFKRRGVDLTLFEAGLGGRLDSTNVVKHPNLAVITGISLEHTQLLGNTLAAIAGEKAGILKEGTPVVLGPALPPEALEVIVQKALALDCPLRYAGEIPLALEPDSRPAGGLRIRHGEGGQIYTLSLLGPYQKDNLAVVLACVQQLRGQGFAISEAALAEGLAHTHWPARFQYFAADGLIVDGSHNAEGLQKLAEALALYFPGQPLTWLLSLRANRDQAMLIELVRQFPATQAVFTTQAEPAHLYHGASSLAQTLAMAGLPAQAFNTPTDALAALQSRPGLKVVTGSLYTAGEILHCLQR